MLQSDALVSVRCYLIPYFCWLLCCLLLHRQWSWPLPLPVQFLGIFPTGGTITDDEQELPWSDELDHKIFISAIGERVKSALASAGFLLHTKSPAFAVHLMVYSCISQLYVTFSRKCCPASLFGESCAACLTFIL